MTGSDLVGLKRSTILDDYSRYIIAWKLDGSKKPGRSAAFLIPLGWMDSEQSMRGQPGFFDIEDRLKRLSDLGDQLETVRLAVDFELFPTGIKCGARTGGKGGGHRSTQC